MKFEKNRRIKPKVIRITRLCEQMDLLIKKLQSTTKYFVYTTYLDGDQGRLRWGAGGTAAPSALIHGGGGVRIALHTEFLHIEHFVEKDMPYNLHFKVLCRLPQAQTNRYGLDSLSFRGSLLWNTLKDKVKRAGTLTKLKKSIVKWDGKSCSCLICK